MSLKAVDVMDGQGHTVTTQMTNTVLRTQVCSTDETQRSYFQSHVFVGVLNGLIFDACVGPGLGALLINDYIRAVIDDSSENERRLSRYWEDATNQLVTHNLNYNGGPMKAFICVIASLIAMRSCIAYTEAELNLLYGNNVGRTPLDNMMEEASKPVSMSMQEYRAIQATNQIPILAEVIASNIAHAVQAGQSTNGVTWTKADELRMSILPPPCPNEGWMHQRGRHLMMLMGVQPGDISAVCTNWIMPSNICVNGISYEVSCDGPDDLEIHAATNMQQSVAHVRHHELSNGKDARAEGFMMYLRNVNRGQVGTAYGLSVSNLDPVTNMMFLSSKKDISPPCDILIYKNLVLHVCAPTNALLFAVEIVNSGLPEEDRIPFPPTP